MSSLLNIRDAIVTTLGALLNPTPPPGLPVVKIDVAAHRGKFDEKELRRITMSAPCVRVALLKVPAAVAVGGQSQTEIRWGAYIITKDLPSGGKVIDRGDVATAIMESILGILPRGNWGAGITGRVSHIAGENFYDSEIDALSLALYGVAWTQSFLLDMSNPVNLASLKTVDVTWPLPGDTAEAQDVITLQGA